MTQKIVSGCVWNYAKTGRNLMYLGVVFMRGVKQKKKGGGNQSISFSWVMPPSRTSHFQQSIWIMQNQLSVEVVINCSKWFWTKDISFTHLIDSRIVVLFSDAFSLICSRMMSRFSLSAFALALASASTRDMSVLKRSSISCSKVAKFVDNKLS